MPPEQVEQERSTAEEALKTQAEQEEMVEQSRHSLVTVFNPNPVLQV